MKETMLQSGIYEGRLAERQLYSGKRAELTLTSMNNYQNLLYNRALFGLSAYKKDELIEMRWDKKKRIIKVHKRAQLILNLWKQEIVNQKIGSFFESFFPESRVFSAMTEPYTDPEYINTLSFKDLKITREEIIFKFMQEGILPRNFNELESVEYVV